MAFLAERELFTDALLSEMLAVAGAQGHLAAAKWAAALWC
jgi:hypothetical protein